MKSVVAAEIAALAAWRVLGVGDRVGSLLLDDQTLLHASPQRSHASVLTFLRQLAQANAALAVGTQAVPEQLNRAFETLLRHVATDALVIYIGDGFGWDGHSDALLKRLSVRNDVLFINIFDPAELNLASSQ